MSSGKFRVINYQRHKQVSIQRGFRIPVKLLFVFAKPYSIRSDEGLTLETSAFESLYGGQFTLSTQLIKPNYLDYNNMRCKKFNMMDVFIQMALKNLLCKAFKWSRFV